jgi:ankyrin repeat protein
MLAGLHTAAATEAMLQRLHQWLNHRPLSPGRDDAINGLLSVLGDQPLEAQVDLDVVEREVMATPLYSESNRLKIKTGLERQREFADRGTHYLLQNLSDAIERGDLPAVQALMERGVDPNAVTIPWGKTYSSRIPGGTTLLNLAVQHDKTDVVQFLVMKGADVNRADSNDAARRPLHHEVSRNAEESAAVVASLIEAGASLDLRDGAGYSALAYAAEFGNLRLVKTLVDAGAPVDTRLTPPIDRNGKSAYNPMPWAVAATPLILAAALGQTETAAYLIQHHADVNAATTTDVTALRIAVSEGQAAMVGLLLDHGANPQAPAPHAPPPLNLSLVALAEAQHESRRATNPIGHLYVLDILAKHGLHANPAAAAKNAAEEAYLKCCYVPLSH